MSAVDAVEAVGGDDDDDDDGPAGLDRPRQ
jgi:hypothetical protein